MDTSKNLLRNAQADPRSDAWNRFVRIYTPLISRWLNRFGVSPNDIPDLTQDVMLAAATELENFEHNGRTGAFRSWLRTVALFRCRRHWRKQKAHDAVTHFDSVNQHLNELADEESDLTQQWDSEHDAFVLRGLFELLEREFDEQTLRVFFQLTINEQPPLDVATEFGVPIGTIYKSKFRVMKRLREFAARYLD